MFDSVWELLIVVLVYSGVERMLVSASIWSATVNEDEHSTTGSFSKKVWSLRVHEILKAEGTDHHFDDILMANSNLLQSANASYHTSLYPLAPLIEISMQIQHSPSADPWNC